MTRKVREQNVCHYFDIPHALRDTSNVYSKI